MDRIVFTIGVLGNYLFNSTVVVKIIDPHFHWILQTRSVVEITTLISKNKILVTIFIQIYSLYYIPPAVKTVE